MRKERAKELRRLALVSYNRNIERQGISFKNWYRRFKLIYNQKKKGEPHV